MPATATDIRTVIAAQLERIRGLYNIDLKYVTEEQAKTSPGGVCRTPLEFTLECARYNLFTAALLRGEQPKKRTEEELAVFAARYDTLEKAKGLLNESVDAILAALKGCAPEDLDKAVTAPWGQPATILELTVGGIQHMYYHDGQLNYFQSLHGDGDVHWMEAAH